MEIQAAVQPQSVQPQKQKFIKNHIDMKAKIFTVLAMIAMTTMVSAQSFNRIAVNIEKGGENDEVYFIESPSFTDEFENSYDEAKGFIGGNVYIYGTTKYGSQSMVCTNDLNSAFIGYRAATDGTATITFKELKSDLADVTTYFLLDTKNNNYIAIGEGASNKYVFEAEAGDFPKRFKLIEPVPSVCFRYNELEVIGYAGKKLVIKDAATETEIVNIASLEAIYFKDLSDKTGRLIVELDGKKILIDANPAVTPAN